MLCCNDVLCNLVLQPLLWCSLILLILIQIMTERKYKEVNMRLLLKESADYWYVTITSFTLSHKQQQGVVVMFCNNTK